MWTLYLVSLKKTHSYKLHGTDYLKQEARILVPSHALVDGTVLKTLSHSEVIEYIRQQIHSKAVQVVSGLNPVEKNVIAERIQAAIPWSQFNLETPTSELEIASTVVANTLASSAFIEEKGLISVDLRKLMPVIADQAAGTRKIHTLLVTLKDKEPMLDTLSIELNKAVSEAVYRYYHGSFKLYGVQSNTQEAYKFILSLSPDGNINKSLKDTVEKGTSITFDLEHNKAWEVHTHPILFAAFQVQQALASLKALSTCSYPPTFLSAEWGTALYLYNLR
jgi:hypothetical protein